MWDKTIGNEGEAENEKKGTERVGKEGGQKRGKEKAEEKEGWRKRGSGWGFYFCFYTLWRNSYFFCVFCISCHEKG